VCLLLHYCTGGAAVACHAQSQTNPTTRTDAFLPAHCRCNSGYAHRPLAEYGTAAVLPDNDCHACPQGHHNAAVGVPACTQCVAGTAVSGTASASITACSQCGSNTFSAAGSATCSACGAASQSPAGSDQEIDCVCNAGFTGVPGGACNTCAAGKFKLLEG